MPKSARRVDRESAVPLLGALVLAVAGLVALLAGWSAGLGDPPPPRVICELVNPATGEHVRLFREIWFKVPAGYDEHAHVATWRAEQEAKGFTVEVGR